MNEEEFRVLNNIIETFVKQARQELQDRWAKWELDLSQREFYEVIGALMARQVTLARSLAEEPSILNHHIAPIILRAMADVYISLAWVLRNPVERARKFVLYGLGQAKLELEHRKAQLVESESTPEEKLFIEASEAWINS